METTTPTPVATPSHWARWRVPAALTALLLLHFLFLARHCPPAFSSPDANGYYAQTALLANEGTTALEPISPLSYIGMHFLETPEGRFFSRYPPGVGVLMVLPYKLLGPDTAVLLTPLLATLSLLLLYLLCRPWIGAGYALLAAALYGLHPLANLHALNWGAHTQSGFFLLAALVAVAAWGRRGRWWLALTAGLMLGIVPTMRYAEVTAGLGIGLFMLVTVLRARAPWWHLAVAMAGVALPMGLLFHHNHLAFGSILSTGYALTGEQQAGSGFRWEFFAAKWRPYLNSLMGGGVGLFCGLGIAGLAAMWRDREHRLTALLLTGAVVPITVVYAAYYWGGRGDMGLRFLLPTLPLYLPPALWFLRRAATLPALGAGLLALVLLQGAVWGVTSVENLERERRTLAPVAKVVDYLEDKVPAGSALIADRRLGDTLQYHGRYALLDGSLFASRTGRRGRGGLGGGPFGGPGGMGPGGRGPGGMPPPGMGPGRFPFPGGGRDGRGAENGERQASPRQQDKAKKLRAAYATGDRTQRMYRIADDLCLLAGERRVFWIGRANAVRTFEENLVEGTDFVEVGRLELPKVEEAGPRGGKMGPGRGRRPGGFGRGALTGELRLYELKRDTGSKK